MKIAQSKKSDLQKMEALVVPDLDPVDGPDIFDRLFSDHTIDIRTGELLGRYIAEEHDTIRTLGCCYEQLQCAAQPAPVATADLSGLEGKVDALGRAVEELRQIICAQTMPANASGRRRS